MSSSFWKVDRPAARAGAALPGRAEAIPHAGRPADAPGRTPSAPHIRGPVPALIGLLAGGLIWALVAGAALVPAYVLPAPGVVLARWWAMLLNGRLWHHASATLQEAGWGFALALAVGLGLGVLLSRSRLLTGLLAPYIAASQAVPVIAIAPLLVLWFGLGLLPKVLICALIVFFPILINTMVGLRGVDKSVVEAARLTAGAGRILWYIEVPLALRAILGGIKMGLTLALTGAVVGEFVAADAGLGFLMTVARSNYDAPTLYAALLTLVALAVLAYGLVAALEQRLIDWE